MLEHVSLDLSDTQKLLKSPVTPKEVVDALVMAFLQLSAANHALPDDKQSEHLKRLSLNHNDTQSRRWLSSQLERLLKQTRESGSSTKETKIVDFLNTFEQRVQGIRSYRYVREIDLSGTVQRSSVSQEDCYQVLGVDRNADVKAIKQAYIACAEVLRPIIEQQDGELSADVKKRANDALKRINNAWGVLRDPRQKSDFDSELTFSGGTSYQWNQTTTQRPPEPAPTRERPRPTERTDGWQSFTVQDWMNYIDRLVSFRELTTVVNQLEKATYSTLSMVDADRVAKIFKQKAIKLIETAADIASTTEDRDEIRKVVFHLHIRSIFTNEERDRLYALSAIASYRRDILIELKDIQDLSEDTPFTEVVEKILSLNRVFAFIDAINSKTAEKLSDLKEMLANLTRSMVKKYGSGLQNAKECSDLQVGIAVLLQEELISERLYTSTVSQINEFLERQELSHTGNEEISKWFELAIDQIFNMWVNTDPKIMFENVSHAHKQLEKARRIKKITNKAYEDHLDALRSGLDAKIKLYIRANTNTLDELASLAIDIDQLFTDQVIDNINYREYITLIDKKRKKDFSWWKKGFL